jgi:flagellar brake protein
MSPPPYTLEALAEAQGGQKEFRIDHPLAIRQVVRALHDGTVDVMLHTSVGSTLATSVWTLDSQREVLHFAVDEFDTALPTVLADSDVVAVAHLDEVKVQFDVADLVLVRGDGSATLRAPFPPVVYRFQRRGSYRVKSQGRRGPLALLRHPQMPDMQLELRVLDVSLAGCALLLPPDVPAIEPGTLFNRVRIELDALTQLDTGLRVHHVSSLTHRDQGQRLGCSLAGLAGDSLRSLQRYVTQAQRRRRAAVA